MARRRPLGLLLIGALLLVMGLRAIGWVLVGGLLEQHTVGLGKQLLGVLITAVVLAAAVGLLRLREWARRLTLGICSLYSGMVLVNVVAGWPHLSATCMSLGLGVLNGIEAVMILGLTWWYLRREEIRGLFRGVR